MTALHIGASKGRTVSTTSGSPPTIATSCPASAGLRDPETGASTKRPPASPTSSASDLEYSGDGVDMLTRVRRCTRVANARSPRASTASVAAPSTSMRITTSQRANTSAGSFATTAPAFARTADLDGVRFQTTSELPAFARFSAMDSPIVPRPMNPMGAPRSDAIHSLLDALAHRPHSPRQEGSDAQADVRRRHHRGEVHRLDRQALVDRHVE